VRRLACALVLLPLLLLGTACRGDGAPARPEVDRQVSDVESTLDAIESELADDE
jgi:hypothetical protein